MTETKQKSFLDIKTKLSEIQSTYENHPSTGFGHFLIIGEKGVGKTSLAKTCPRPVFIHSFDPGGTDSLLKYIGPGEGKEIYVDPIPEEDDAQKPTAYLHWQRDFRAKVREGFFSEIGTYVLDSTTTMAECLINQILAAQNRQIPSDASVKFKRDGAGGKGMQIQDWGVFLNYWHIITRMVLRLPCHAMLLGHVDRFQNAVNSRIERTIMLPGQSKDRVPQLFPEYFLLKQDKAGVRTLLTRHDGDYQATTRIGAEGLFEKEEPADIRALLKKAGLPHEDKQYG